MGVEDRWDVADLDPSLARWVLLMLGTVCAALAITLLLQLVSR